MRVSIVIPAYNEEERIGNTLNEYGRFFKDLKNQGILDFEIVIVINCSTDKTEEIVKKYSKEYKEIVYFVLKEKGKGLAIIEGFKDALTRNNDLIGFVDADLATGPEAFYDLARRIKTSDVAIASRYVKGAVVHPKQTPKRILMSRVFNILVRTLFFMPYRDTQCGAKLIKRHALERTIDELKITQWAIDINILYALRKKDFRIKEIPTVWSDKSGSKINWKRTSLGMAFAVIRLRIINSPFRRFLKPMKMFVGKLWRAIGLP